MAKFMKTSSATNATLLDTTLLNVPSQSEAFNLFNLIFHLKTLLVVCPMVLCNGTIDECCNSDCPCGENEGDCDNDSECDANLKVR